MTMKNDISSAKKIKDKKNKHLILGRKTRQSIATFAKSK